MSKTQKIKAPRGTSDYLPEKAELVHWLDCQAGKIFGDYQYRRVVTPTFEDTALFARSIGEASDIVRKEMYTFRDKAGRSLTLRPEATASVVRAFIEHNLGSGVLPVKLYYFANMFRYERPQAGRYREFWQLGVEALGSADPAIDAEAITLAMEYIKSLGIGEAILKLGSMGDDRCRSEYMVGLREFLKEVVDELCEDCKQRLDLNPLRVFDCKNHGCRAVLAAAPKIVDCLCDECRDHFISVQDLLKTIDIDFEIDPMLVRGFDYYTRTTFEVQSAGLGAQNALGGGGRYDRLVGDYGGPPTPAVGFALGIERLILAMAAVGGEDRLRLKTEFFVAVIETKDKPIAFDLIAKLRRAGLPSEIDYMGRSLRAQMKLAAKLKAAWVVVLGPDELVRGEVVVRNLDTGDEIIKPLKDVVEWARKGCK